jgi:splicing factor 3B subunit 3
LVLSFVDATLVLGIGETVEEVSDSGFLTTVTTMSASRIGDDSLLQVYPEGIRHIRYDGRVNEWKTPSKTLITHCAVNEQQVAIALSNGELVYFELDRSGQLNEYTERVEMSSQVTALALAPVPDGQQTARFMALGLDDQTVRIISLDPNSCLQPLSMQALPGVAASLCFVQIAGLAGEPASLSLSSGLDNGVLVRTRVDTVTGMGGHASYPAKGCSEGGGGPGLGVGSALELLKVEQIHALAVGLLAADLSDTRTRYLGSRSVKLFAVRVSGAPAVLALSSKPWLSYRFQARGLTMLAGCSVCVSDAGGGPLGLWVCCRSRCVPSRSPTRRWSMPRPSPRSNALRGWRRLPATRFGCWLWRS